MHHQPSAQDCLKQQLMRGVLLCIRSGPALGHAFSSMGPGMVPSGGLPPLPPAPGGGALGFGLDGGFGGFSDGDGHLLRLRHTRACIKLTSFSMALLEQCSTTGHCCTAGGFGRHGGRGGFGGSGGGGRFTRRGRSGGRGAGPLLNGPSRGDANDYCQHFVDTGQRPQNFLRDAHMVCQRCTCQCQCELARQGSVLTPSAVLYDAHASKLPLLRCTCTSASPMSPQADKDRFAEYPKLRDLVAAKDEQVKRFATPPMFLKVCPRSHLLSCKGSCGRSHAALAVAESSM